MQAEYSESENVIRRLHEITQAYDKGFNVQMEALIRLGMERFKLDIGILARVEGDTYIVDKCVCPEHMPLKPGDEFEFGMTYCAVTCEADGVVAVEHVGQSDVLGTHPAYRQFGLESYIAVPIHIGGMTWGTLNFSSPAPYPREFKPKDVDALQLMASWIEVEMVRRRQEEQLRTLNAKLKEMASVDPLTNLMNRRAFMDLLERSLNQMQRCKSGGEAAVLLLDIDYFKSLNDNYGHLLGDKMLVEFANVMQRNLRSYDAVARYGGDEFIIWLGDTSREGIEAVCDRMMSGLNQSKAIDENVTVSIGIFHFRTRVAEQDWMAEFVQPEQIIDVMIAKADQALYQAKAAGRARYQFYSEGSVYLDTLS
ncbi:sensor domain-containing diguanylate cyclase [Photobacterium sp. GJ3]|uniref:sensor domain-containing diguanylate cyclase n=1 Tax=Photobacterium sp. GJ3 TaxID=2829502 RepID=UPI001B8B5246|nr:sensor domain-containing diguanylate cyclase [Photobacterium sp. GJ3]QUJ68560.1 sensor domain-containing diguanylate cyclase [Photobacterium sp. GJ3]